MLQKAAGVYLLPLTTGYIKFQLMTEYPAMWSNTLECHILHSKHLLRHPWRVLSHMLTLYEGKDRAF